MITTNSSEISRQTLHFGAGGMVKNFYGYSKDLPFDGANNPNQLRRVVWDNDPSGEENFAQGEFLILNNIPFGSFCAHELENPGSYPALRQLENLGEVFNNLGHQLVLEGGCRGDRRNGAGALQVSA